MFKLLGNLSLKSKNMFLLDMKRKDQWNDTIRREKRKIWELKLIEFKLEEYDNWLIICFLNIKAIIWIAYELSYMYDHMEASFYDISGFLFMINNML